VTTFAVAAVVVILPTAPTGDINMKHLKVRGTPTDKKTGREARTLSSMKKDDKKLLLQETELIVDMIQFLDPK
jgi:hypothetical protein